MIVACAARSGPAAAPPAPEYARAPLAPAIVEREPAAQQLLEDEAVAAAVRRELAELGAGPDCGVVPMDIEVDRGIVVLEGNVPSLLHAQVARERAETVRGVRGVVNRLRVPPLPVTDEELAETIRSRFDDDPSLGDAAIEVASHLGRVRLRGTVASFTQKKLAEDIALGVRGVREVANELEFQPRARSDEEIQSDIAARIAYDAYLADDVLNVDVERRVANLSGAVGSFMEKRRAATQAWVSGVVGVNDDHVAVDLALQDRDQRQARPRPSDEQVTLAVRDALDLDPAVAAAVLDVEVEAGIARLGGFVPHLRAKRAAERDAEHTVGVWMVESRIVVRPPAPVTDAALEQLVRARLGEDTGLHGPGRVEVQAGRVILRGAVSDPIVRQSLMRSVEAIPGVVEIVDELARAPRPPVVRSDAALERDIQRALWWDVRVQSARVDVDVQDGVAVVTGQAPSRAVHDAIMENVWQAGPRSAEDRLELTPAPSERPGPKVQP